MTGAGETGHDQWSPWAGRFEAQSLSCRYLGSDVYARLMTMLARDVRHGGVTRELLAGVTGLRFGDAVPLRLVAAAHLVALEGRAERWAAMLPSCSGTVPDDDQILWDGWSSVVAANRDELVEGVTLDVQTNEVGRSAGLALAIARTGFRACELVEIGCSGALNLRLDRYRVELGDRVLGDPRSVLVLSPEMRGASPAGQVGVDRATGPIGGVNVDPTDDLALPTITSRTGIDPHPIDVTTQTGRLRLESFLWPDQDERVERLRQAISIAALTPVDLITTDDTAGALAAVLEAAGPRVVMHSIVWQYIPKEMRWAITTAIEAAGDRATVESPLAWIRYEPDEWNRARAAIWLRTWPDGGDRLVAHADYHGRWLSPS